MEINAQVSADADGSAKTSDTAISSAANGRTEATKGAVSSVADKPAAHTADKPALRTADGPTSYVPKRGLASKV